MNKLAKLVAAVHASVLAAGAASGGVASAQDQAEVAAYMEAISVGTPEAIARFLQAYPASALPGSELGARIAASVGPTDGAARPQRDAAVIGEPTLHDGLY